MVYVLDKDGNPLMPTERHAHVRRLLKSKQATVACLKPFTIKLLYAANKTQPVTLGIDPGRTNIGVTAVTPRGEVLFTANVTTRNKDIPKLMKKRAAYRRNHRNLKRRRTRQRRAIAHQTAYQGVKQRHLPGYDQDKFVPCHHIKNKQARFNNRKRPDGWLTPTANQLLQTHINVIKKLAKFLPITNIHIELNKFAFMRLDDPSVHEKDFQNGILKGFDQDVKKAVYAFQNGKCLICGNNIECYHHVVARHKNGSETIRNRVGLCNQCHKAVHTNQTIANKLQSIASGQYKKYDALGILNQIIPYLIQDISRSYPMTVTTGRQTKEFRKEHNLPKDHFLDAYAIACCNMDLTTIPNTSSKIYQIQQFRRHDRQACEREMLNRNYMSKNQKVAMNRHKATEQTQDSLEEYVAKGGNTDCLTVKHTKKAMKDPYRPLPGAQVIQNGKVKTMLKKSSGYHWFDDNSKIWASKTRFDTLNTGLVFVSNIQP